MRGRPPLDPATTHRRCSKCSNEKPLADFTKAPKQSLGYGYVCKECHRQYKAVWRYGITVDRIEEMKAEQGYRCLICQLVKPLVVDHCHASGKVRGLLCQNCNSGLGKFFDRPDVLDRAKAYVIQNQASAARVEPSQRL